MKALFVSNDPKIFDPASVVRARMRLYAEAIGTLHIVSRGPANAELVTREELADGSLLVLHCLRTSKIGALLHAPVQIRKIILEEEIQVVSAQDPFEYGYIAYRAVRGTSAKLHIQVHTDFLSPQFVSGLSRMAILNRIRVRIADYVLPRAAAIRVVSVRIKNRILARYGTIAKPAVLPIRVPEVTDVSAVSFPPHDFSFVIFAVGRLEEEKRFQDCLRALTGVHNRYPDVGLFIADNGRERPKLERLARDLEIADKVVFLGHRTDVQGLMRSADLFIQASAYEGYGLTLLEAALAHLPIITTDVGIVGEVLEKDEDVVVVPFANPASMAHEIISMIEDAERRHALAEHAEHTALEYVRSQSSSPRDIACNLEQALTSSL